MTTSTSMELDRSGGTLNVRPRTEALAMSRQVFDRAVRLFRNQPSYSAEQCVLAATEAMALAHALRENPANNGPDQHGYWSAAHIDAHYKVVALARQRKAGR